MDPDKCEDLDSSRVDDDQENLYVRHKDSLERLLESLEREGVSATMLYAYAEAKDYAQQRMDLQDGHDQEVKRGVKDPAIVTVWGVLEGNFDAELDDARESVDALYDEIAAALVAIHGPRCENCNGFPMKVDEQGNTSTCDVCEGHGWVPR